MKKNKNEIYMLVDEKYLSKFSFNHHTSDILKTRGHYETIQHIGHSDFEHTSAVRLLYACSSKNRNNIDARC